MTSTLSLLARNWRRTKGKERRTKKKKKEKRKKRSKGNERKKLRQRMNEEGEDSVLMREKVSIQSRCW